MFQPGRWGGEEFLIVLGDYNGKKDEIIEYFEKIRKCVEDSIIECDGNKINVTVTIGVTFFDQDKSMDELIKESDAKLYEGKENGRNQVVC